MPNNKPSLHLQCLPEEIVSLTVECVGVLYGLLQLMTLSLVCKDFKKYVESAFAKNHAFFKRVGVFHTNQESPIDICFVNNMVCLATSQELTVYDYEEGIELMRMPFTIINQTSEIIRPAVRIFPCNEKIFVALFLGYQTFTLIIDSKSLDVIGTKTFSRVCSFSVCDTGFDLVIPSYRPNSQNYTLLMFKCADMQSSSAWEAKLRQPPLILPHKVVDSVRTDEQIFILFDTGLICGYNMESREMVCEFNYRIAEPVSITTIGGDIVASGKHVFTVFSSKGILYRRQYTKKSVTRTSRRGEELAMIEDGVVNVYNG